MASPCGALATQQYYSLDAPNANTFNAALLNRPDRDASFSYDSPSGRVNSRPNAIDVLPRRYKKTVANAHGADWVLSRPTFGLLWDRDTFVNFNHVYLLL
jgi:hypothetical protein